MAEVPDVIEAARLRRKRLLEQLGASPVINVLGVVAPSGVGGGKSPGDNLWTLQFELAAWRIYAGDIHLQPLTVQRAVTDKELKRLQDRITPYTVIRIDARVVADSLLCLLESLVGIDTSDAELNQFAVQLQEPVTHEDPLLGIFTLDRRTDCFTGEVIWEGKPVSLNLSATDPAEVQGALRTAYSLWQNQNSWNRRIRDYAVERLLPLKNRNWLGKGKAELSADQFKDRMTLEAIAVDPDGSFDFWHDDGNMFGGHTIQISGSLSDGPTHADIPG